MKSTFGLPSHPARNLLLILRRKLFWPAQPRSAAVHTEMLVRQKLAARRRETSASTSQQSARQSRSRISLNTVATEIGSSMFSPQSSGRSCIRLFDQQPFAADRIQELEQQAPAQLFRRDPPAPIRKQIEDARDQVAATGL